MFILFIVFAIIVSAVVYYFYNDKHFCCWHDCEAKDSIRKIKQKFRKCNKFDPFVKDGYVECAILKECCICNKKKWGFGYKNENIKEAMKLKVFNDDEVIDFQIQKPRLTGGKS